VHCALLVASSKLFQNAMKSEWRTISTQPLDVFDVKTEDFERYSQWLYTKQVPTLTWEILSRLYVFGEQILDEEFQKAMLSAMIEAYRTVSPAMSTVRRIYNGTITNSPARQLLNDLCTHSLSPSSRRLIALDPERDGHIMKDLIAALVNLRAKPGKRIVGPWKEKLANYRVSKTARNEPK
jgi:hypothetical protein